MKTTITSLAIAAALFGAGAPRVAAQAPNRLRIYTAIEVEYQTEIGKRYTLQGAVNLTNWTDIGNPVLGHGRLVNQTFSTKNGGAVSYAAYRLQVSDGPTNGFAPWSLAGARLQMDDHSSNSVEYLDDHGGRDLYAGAPDPFTYEFTRLGANEARVDRTFTPDRRELVTYAYSAPGVGTWVREEYRGSSLERRVLGVFRYLADGTNSVPGVTNPPVVITPPQPPAPPTILTGLVYYVQSGARPDKLMFNTLTTGIETPLPSTSGDEDENEVSPGGNIFTYSYHELGSNSASLIVNFGYYGFGGDKNEYDLTYTDGPSGTFVRRIYRLGSLYSTDNGAFSPYAPQPGQTPGNTNLPPVVTNAPPTNPVGFTYTMHDGSTPPRLVFQSTSSGIEFDDSAPSDFTFTYAATGANTFALRAQFKPDRWDEYDLTFTNGAQGTLVRRQFKNSQLNRTTSGTFTIAVTGN